MATDHQVTEQPEPPAGRTPGMILTAVIAMDALAVPILFVLRSIRHIGVGAAQRNDNADEEHQVSARTPQT